VGIHRRLVVIVAVLGLVAVVVLAVVSMGVDLVVPAEQFPSSPSNPSITATVS